jgi:hypothetical protein
MQVIDKQEIMRSGSYVSGRHQLTATFRDRLGRRRVVPKNVQIGRFRITDTLARKRSPVFVSGLLKSA